MEVRMNLSKEKKEEVEQEVAGFAKSLCKRVVDVKVAVFLLFLVVLSQAATDYSSLTTGVTEDISSISTVLMGIGAAIIGVSLIFVIYRLVKRMIGG